MPILLAALLALSGCGMPGAPLPPSLNLPVPVSDLSAVRTGGQVALAWTMPRRTTDKVLLKGNIAVRICRNENAASPCSVTATLSLAPGAFATFTDNLPSALAAGAPRELTYSIELVNSKGRSAGFSNRATILAGQAPSAISGLAAEMARNGVLLRWTHDADQSSPPAIRIVRRLLSPPAGKTNQAQLASPPEPLEQTLLVEPAPVSDRALDTNIRLGASYEYRAQRVARVAVGGAMLDLAGPLSPPVQIDAINIYPPRAPRGLEAVATAGENGAGPAVDLSWLPNSESDLAGYIVYRREQNASSHATEWQRISFQPVVGPGYHDATVQADHIYIYAVTAIDRDGRESARSSEASETVPAP